MQDTSLARALSSEERWKILDLLVTNPLSVSQISNALGISVRSARAHLAELANVHLVEVTQRKRGSGKEVTVYRIAPSARTLGFPPRNYEFLSEALITGLISSLGEKSARLVIKDIGLKLGEQMGHSLLNDSDSTAFTMKEYGDLVIKGFLASQSAYPQILSQNTSEIVYEQFNCPFQELAARMPKMVCDVLDGAVHEGLDRALGVKTTRISCKGHGEEGCRFRVASPG